MHTRQMNKNNLVLVKSGVETHPIAAICVITVIKALHSIGECLL